MRRALLIVVLVAGVPWSARAQSTYPAYPAPGWQYCQVPAPGTGGICYPGNSTTINMAVPMEVSEPPTPTDPRQLLKWRWEALTENRARTRAELQSEASSRNPSAEAIASYGEDLEKLGYQISALEVAIEKLFEASPRGKP